MQDNDLISLKLPAGVQTADLKYELSPIGRIAQKTSYVGWAIWARLATMPGAKNPEEIAAPEPRNPRLNFPFCRKRRSLRFNSRLVSCESLRSAPKIRSCPI